MCVRQRRYWNWCSEYPPPPVGLLLTSGAFLFRCLCIKNWLTKCNVLTKHWICKLFLFRSTQVEVAKLAQLLKSSVVSSRNYSRMLMFFILNVRFHFYHNPDTVKFVRDDKLQRNECSNLVHLLFMVIAQTLLRRAATAMGVLSKVVGCEARNRPHPGLVGSNNNNRRISIDIRDCALLGVSSGLSLVRRFHQGTYFGHLGD